MLALKLILKDKGGKQHCLTFVVSNLVFEIFFEKKGTSEKDALNEGLRHLCILCIGVSRKFYAAPVYFLIVFLVIKGILKALFSFFPWLLNLSDLPNYGSNSRKRYTLRLLSKCLGRSTPSLLGIKSPPQPLDSLFDSLRWAPFSLALHLCSS